MILMFMTAIIVHYTVQVNDLHIALAESNIKQAEQSNKLYDLEQISEENALVVNRYNEQINNINHTLSIHENRLDLHRSELNEYDALFDDVLSYMDEIEEHMRTHPEPVINVRVSEKDIRDIASLVFLEAGSQSYSCKKAIASVIFNRMIKYHLTAQEVIYQRTRSGERVFSPAYKVSSTNPSSSCLMAVRDVLMHGQSIPKNVTAFRNCYYHNFGRPYKRIDNVYFSYE